MKVCDLTQFYSPVGGGVRRYLSEKVRFIREHSAEDEHLLIVPGERDEVRREERSSVYTIRSPLISRTSRYRALLRLEAIEEILETERPDLIESGDPYQVAWKAVHSGSALRIPVIGFYHSHFPEAYLRSARKFLGQTATEFILDFSRRYIRNLYNRFERTIVPSPALEKVLTEWGVRNTRKPISGSIPPFSIRNRNREKMSAPSSAFRPTARCYFTSAVWPSKKIPTPFSPRFNNWPQRAPDRFHLLVIGDGLQRAELEKLRASLDRQGTKSSIAGFRSKIENRESRITWLSYCNDAARLAAIYRAADLFVHPGVQETFGLVSLEAQACGTPVIGIRGSYMDRIIHGDQQHWSRENSAESLATAILQTSMPSSECRQRRVKPLRERAILLAPGIYTAV